MRDARHLPVEIKSTVTIRAEDPDALQRPWVRST
jgi:hypothetical protein